MTTDFERYTRYALNVIRGVKGYTLNNAKKYFKARYTEFLTVYSKILEAVETLSRTNRLVLTQGQIQRLNRIMDELSKLQELYERNMIQRLTTKKTFKSDVRGLKQYINEYGVIKPNRSELQNARQGYAKLRIGEYSKQLFGEFLVENYMYNEDGNLELTVSGANRLAKKYDDYASEQQINSLRRENKILRTKLDLYKETNTIIQEQMQLAQELTETIFFVNFLL